ncbi:GNAT family N-acetyltransferase [Vibrio navarrensis]|uniref:GNAT family N-acetyltransferase n=1 Tax=Vibrio navarrensis TaxID=29495 RepID=UPI00186AB570|nr:GNAT family N-acetyltransferase [Vibrio navarrensis]EJK2113734.1 GNAT family N-acetyltransferase [Vibrio navarrensis]MBE4578055.1 GNAT family N-acetyltransferase [Vibrio navarrensis]MBE4588503.1 GNAT family N-acetyltransferase [Vibrio navarrensis]MBE4596656.1 GNAT family N-acetyltransferase [Vibrio navarrensis]MBE4600660.1 GNAT family N-acetyltransferase [Vibrio navarrensis]
MIQWHLVPFSQLSTTQLYQLLKLRVDVFVVEQNCPYPELDGNDILHGVHHLLGYKNGELVACTRLLPAGTTYDSVSIGRVATKHNARGGGLGHQLMQKSIMYCQQLWPNEAIEIGAQEHLKPFYQQHGFVVTSEVYLEDGIPHVDMKRA